MNINTDFSYYKKNNDLLYDIPVFISPNQLLIDSSVVNKSYKLKEYNNINISDKFIRDLSMYDYKTFNEFFENKTLNNRYLILGFTFIVFIVFILFILFFRNYFFSI